MEGSCKPGQLIHATDCGNLCCIISFSHIFFNTMKAKLFFSAMFQYGIFISFLICLDSYMNLNILYTLSV